jgi:hypothetical protein
MEYDWLLDLRHYDYNFRANRASILIDELGLACPIHESRRETQRKPAVVRRAQF